MTSTAPTAVEALESGRALRLRWADGVEASWPAIWLRDHCQDAACRHPGNGQRLFGILDLPEDVRIERAGLAGDGGVALVFAPEGHATRFDPAWLRDHRSVASTSPPQGWLPPHITLWGGGLVPPCASLAAVESDERALLGWLAAVDRHGFALLDGVPPEPGAVERVVALFGFVRETNYGRIFDVRAEPDPSNLAYTAMGLQVHTDNPYRDPVPGLQLLHCLQSGAVGGDSVVVDGFCAATVLREELPEAFELLTRCPVRWEYRAGATELVARAPMIGLAADGELVEIRFNNRSLAAVEAPADRVEAFYAAYRAFARILERPALELVFKLAPGQLFIVDNRRVLHGRKAFSAAGRRWLQGTYADRDGLRSRLAVLRRRYQEEDPACPPPT
ncbi:MAG TPA: TauD/TfdA family dioxygenase [Geminicoccaceae bacterium]|nr:TauD/TfdA family dioxygenase [Geminicoccaceae bacterium]